MYKFDKYFSKLIIYPIFPILFFLIFWWTSIAFTKTISIIIVTALSGLTIGILANIIFSNKIINKFYDLNYIYLVLILLFYNIGIFGFFMGVPVFNIIPGILSGVYLARKEITGKIKNKWQNIKIYQLFNTFILFSTCFTSGFIALVDPYTSNSIEEMFNLQFQINNFILYMIIIIGGVILLLIQYWGILIIYKFFKNRNI